MHETALERASPEPERGRHRASEAQDARSERPARWYGQPSSPLDSCRPGPANSSGGEESAARDRQGRLHPGRTCRAPRHAHPASSPSLLVAAAHRGRLPTGHGTRRAGPPPRPDATPAGRPAGGRSFSGSPRRARRQARRSVAAWPAFPARGRSCSRRSRPGWPTPPTMCRWNTSCRVGSSPVPGRSRISPTTRPRGRRSNSAGSSSSILGSRRTAR